MVYYQNRQIELVATCEKSTNFFPLTSADVAAGIKAAALLSEGFSNVVTQRFSKFAQLH